ncbi:MAG TPA: hypothetical protein VIM81_19960 [Gammaproteobacteria bacterium]
MAALRLPLAVSTSGLIGIGMFWLLWSLISGPSRPSNPRLA